MSNDKCAREIWGEVFVLYLSRAQDNFILLRHYLAGFNGKKKGGNSKTFKQNTDFSSYLVPCLQSQLVVR